MEHKDEGDAAKSTIPVEAEILKVAGLPGSTGSGTICTPLTFTG